MSCEDCIHYNKSSSNLCKKWILPLERDKKPCNYFQSKSACDNCIYAYPDCLGGEYDKENSEVLDLTKCSIRWCAYQTTKVDESRESVSK